MSSSVNMECLYGRCIDCLGMGCEHVCHRGTAIDKTEIKKPSPFASRREWRTYYATIRAAEHEKAKRTQL